MTYDGCIVEFELTPANTHDLTALKQMVIDLPKESILFADKAYNDYNFEQKVQQEKQVQLKPIRRKNMKCEDNTKQENKYRSRRRRKIESWFSVLTSRFGRKIHAVTLTGWITKVTGFVVAYNLTKFIDFQFVTPA
jgi:IS5 family transposase